MKKFLAKIWSKNRKNIVFDKIAFENWLRLGLRLGLRLKLRLGLTREGSQMMVVNFKNSCLLL